MRFIFLVFIISAASLAEEIRVKIKPSDILHMLEIFSTYFKYGEKDRKAYAGLPNSPSVTIEVTAEQETEYLTIKGPFYQKKWKKMNLVDCVYTEDLYFKDSKFYGFIINQFEEIPGGTELIYKQKEEKQRKHPYISTTFISMDDLEKAVVSFFAQYKKYYDRIRDIQYRVNFLVTPPNYGGHFIEFNFIRTLGSHVEIPPMPRFGLVGSNKEKEISVIEEKQNPSIHYYEDNGKIITIPENVLGVRTTGLLAISDDTDPEHPILLHYEDLSNAKKFIEEGHAVTPNEFLGKLQTIEPTTDTLDQARSRRVPGDLRPIITEGLEVLFQIRGHAMAKKESTLDDSELKREWPFMVEFHGRKGSFQLDILGTTMSGNRIYTDDNRLALAVSDGNIQVIRYGCQLHILYQEEN